jgi:hypothetical protein
MLIKGAKNQAPMLVAGFLYKNIGQFTTSLSTINTLTVTISTNALLSSGSTIKFLNLVGAKFADSSITIQSRFGSSLSFVNATVVQNTLQMTVFGNIEPSSLYIFAFNVTNADNVQAAPMISICANIDPVNTCKHAALECPTKKLNHHPRCPQRTN